MDRTTASKEAPARPRIIVLTGGIASGKTAVSDRLARAGIRVIDTDVIARDVVSPGSPGLARIVEVFGEDVLQANGALDRKALRQRIFDSTSARHQLDSITHPLIEEKVRAAILAARGEPVVVLVVPLLIESGLFQDADEIVVVDVPEDTQIERLMRRDGIDAGQAQRILEAQASRAERLARADRVIDNSGSLSQLEARIDQFIDQLGFEPRSKTGRTST
jgi:dephospho-CoA kinase